jgi:hypothetical protein
VEPRLERTLQKLNGVSRLVSVTTNELKARPLFGAYRGAHPNIRIADHSPRMPGKQNGFYE